MIIIYYTLDLHGVDGEAQLVVQAQELSIVNLTLLNVLDLINMLLELVTR